MFDADPKSNLPVQNVEPGGVKIIIDFLKLSTRPDTSGQAVEDHLLSSLAIAWNAQKVAN